ncbi:MAG: hypothetical protein EF806_00365 [Candidatus Methanoliparum thermophilum]|uniref:S-layer protein n=1 Tax=Methanoliparum thermophilum TaxID=2491083 RepID=A0A520KTH7_METT2|nr:hypothetical protein [Candidatus Methanoliparum sp. LAM-1]RZN65389.1 MAG: hypothetical protein EF806_00365 [Candidatus Methanoliparum thermophilum]BDC35523.1 hypothetical protein MTLP_02050 [Candidatus Methanoliparum sp. LAM-1]
MNKFIFSIFTVSLILILSIITLPTTNALSIEESNLNGPVAPDTRINISIPIINDNNQKKDVTIVLKYAEKQSSSSSPLFGSSPFGYPSNSQKPSSFEHIGLMKSSDFIGDLNRGEKAYANFVIYIDKDAPSGIYNLEVTARYTDFMIVPMTETIGVLSIPVVNNPSINIIGVSKGILTPGSVNNLTIDLKNVGKYPKNDISIKINPMSSSQPEPSIIPEDLTKILGVTDETEQDLNKTKELISPVGSGNTFYVGDLLPGESRSLNIKLFADYDIKKGVYSLPVTIYAQGISYEENIPVLVMAGAKLSIPVVETNPRVIMPEDKITIVATIENSGGDAARSVSVEILDNGYITGEGNMWNVAYAGIIPAEDSSYVIFQIFVVNGAPEQLPLYMKVKYTDDLGDHEIIEKVELNVVYSQEDDSSYNTRLIGVIVGILIIIAVLGVYLYKRRAKR